MANLGVPILLQATPDTPSRMSIRDRRDSFCGKMSACNNLAQYGIPYSLTTLHTEAPDSEIFRTDLDWFLAVCRVVKGLTKLQIAAISARPAPCNTVRYSRKLLRGATVSQHLHSHSQTPTTLLNWHNNYAADPDQAVYFHCRNRPQQFFQESRMYFQEIIAGPVGKENTFGTVVGRVKSGPMSFARFSTNDREGKISGYVGEGAFTEDSLETFCCAGVVRIPELQTMLRFIFERGFAHHVAANFSTVASAVHEAATRYLGC